MCSIVGSVTIDEGWKVVVNEQGTYVEGTVDLPDNAAMFLRTTYSFAESTDIQVCDFHGVHGAYAYD